MPSTNSITDAGEAALRKPMLDMARALDDKFIEVTTERLRQDAIHGGADHDDTLEPQEWASKVIEHANKALRQGEFRARMIEVAAVALAAVQAYDRGGAQYLEPAARRRNRATDGAS